MKYGLKAALIFSAAVLTLLSGCSGSGNTPTGTVVVAHDTSDIPAGVDHITYTGLDASGNMIYGPVEFDIAGSHTLGGMPIQVTKLKLLFHSEAHEELNDVDRSMSVMEGASTTVQGCPCPATEFLAKRVAIVHQTAAGNILARGNLPMITNDADKNALPVAQRYFAFNELNGELRDRLGDSHFDLNDYQLIVMTLIDNGSDLKQFTGELQGFGLTPADIYTAEGCSSPYDPPVDFCSAWAPSTSFGTSLTTEGASHTAVIIWWPVYACGDQTCSTAEYVERGLDKFKLIDQPAYMETLLNGVSAKPRLIYFHCMQGTDRTGALHALYLMSRDASLTLPAAFEIAEKSTRNETVLRPACVYAHLARAYCLRAYAGSTRCDLPACK